MAINSSKMCIVYAGLTKTEMDNAGTNPFFSYDGEESTRQPYLSIVETRHDHVPDQSDDPDLSIRRSGVEQSHIMQRNVCCIAARTLVPAQCTLVLVSIDELFAVSVHHSTRTKVSNS